MTSDLEGGNYAHLNERLLQIVDARDNQTIRMRNSIKMQKKSGMLKLQIHLFPVITQLLT